NKDTTIQQWLNIQWLTIQQWLNRWNRDIDPSGQRTHTIVMEDRISLCIIAATFLSLAALTAAGPCDDISNGGYLVKNVVVNKWDTPCLIQNDLIIATKYTLTLNAGSELRFMPGVM